ncbi:hypothetical protein [Microbacterium aurum]
MSGIAAYGWASVSDPTGVLHSWGPRLYQPDEYWNYETTLDGYTCADLPNVWAQAWGDRESGAASPEWTSGRVVYPDAPRHRHRLRYDSSVADAHRVGHADRRRDGDANRLGHRLAHRLGHRVAHRLGHRVAHRLGHRVAHRLGHRVADHLGSREPGRDHDRRGHGNHITGTHRC